MDDTTIDDTIIEDTTIEDTTIEDTTIETCPVKWKHTGKICMVPRGKNLLEVMRKENIWVEAPCGGHGTCGKCRVTVDGVEVLACQTSVEHAMEIEIEAGKNQNILTKGIERNVSGCPEVEGIAAAFDIGTTTLAGYLIDTTEGKTLAVESRINPQAKFGADVVTRCQYTLEHGEEEICLVIRKAVNEMIQEMCRKSDSEKKQVKSVYCVGNTCMYHLFLGLPIKTLVMAPYEPTEKKMQVLPAAKCEIDIHPQGKIIWLPCIAGFVGADTLACLLAADFRHREALTLLVDIGTNGEIVLGNKEGSLCCSTAAGPALEGALISCGMRGKEGAIDHVKLGEDGSVCCHVIGETKAEGICGSGLVDLISVLLACGLMEETGRLKKKEELKGEQREKYGSSLTEIDGKPAVVLKDQITLTQKDIREVQLAKAAIAAGIRLLIKYRKKETEQLKEILLAGAFGSYLNPENAVRIGLLPEEYKDRIRVIGNAAGEGAKLAALSREILREAEYEQRHTQNLKLECLAEFQDVFTEELSFPEMN